MSACPRCYLFDQADAVRRQMNGHPEPAAGVLQRVEQQMHEAAATLARCAECETIAPFWLKIPAA